jgi:FkbM family methyltransferase
MDFLANTDDSPAASDDQQADEAAFTPETYRQSVGDVDAVFRIETAREHRRVRTLMHETEILEAVLDAVEEDDVFYDVGANVGVHTCFVGQRADRVVAFEPHPETAAKLAENAQLNDVDVEVYEHALADENQSATLSLPADTPQSLGTGEYTLRSVERAGQTFDASVVRGDAVVREDGLHGPDVAKVDVEGAELATLDGFASTLRECRTLYVEVHLDHVTVNDVRAKLDELGFASSLLKERGNTAFLAAEGGR